MRNGTGRPTNAQTRERRRRKVQDDLEEIALDAAPDALRTLMRAFKPEPGLQPPTREQIQAATYVLNQVIGRPTQKAEAPDSNSRVDEILNAILQERKRAVAAITSRDADVVEPDGL